MITTLISIFAAVAAFLLFFLLFGAIGAILPAIVVFIGTFIIISRQIAKRLEKDMKKLQEDLMKGHVEQAMLALQSIKARFSRWQFFLGSTIDGQVGTIHYMKGDYKKARPYLERAFVKHWIAKAMLALIYYRERNFEKMHQIFEYASKYNKKSGMLWSLWAYCYWRLGEIDKAIFILNQGKKHLNDKDQVLLANLRSLQNDKKMKMKGYGEQWYQFQLELSPQQVEMKQGRVRFKSR